jgi:hypothetical protein
MDIINERFKNRREALAWLQQRGRISRGKFYDDCTAGAVTVYQDKTVSKFAVAVYAERLFKPSPPAPDAVLLGQREADEARKIKAEADIKEMQADEARRELGRKWLYRDEANDHLAVIITCLQQALEHRAKVAADAIIKLSDGNAAHSFDVSEGMQELVIDAAFNEVASAGTLRVRFKGEQDIEDQLLKEIKP